jgi:cobalamin biosynthesis protein CbiD
MREAGGDQSFQLVYWLTNPSKGVKKPRAYRKQMDREHIAVAPHPAKIIKMFDRICNLNDLYECNDMDFLALYASESRLLWDVLKDADEKLARDMLAVIEQVERRAQNGINTRSSQDPQNLSQD